MLIILFFNMICIDNISFIFSTLMYSEGRILRKADLDKPEKTPVLFSYLPEDITSFTFDPLNKVFYIGTAKALYTDRVGDESSATYAYLLPKLLPVWFFLKFSWYVMRLCFECYESVPICFNTCCYPPECSSADPPTLWTTSPEEFTTGPHQPPNQFILWTH